ncbi:MAG: CotH kinase family protein [Christensenellales bacterium]|jgi:hypothetical protein
MIKHRKIDIICVFAIILAMALTVLLINGEDLGIAKAISTPPYASRLFDQNRVHTIDIRVDESDWQSLLQNAADKEYINCAAVIDGEMFSDIGIRAKGSNSLRQIAKYGSQRFSLKLKFNHYEKGGSYYGLDRLSLNASFQDNAFLKDYMTYDMMRHMDVAAPLCSYAFVTVNGEDWGLFVAIEEIREAFNQRNFGRDTGIIYKPEYRTLEDDNSDVALIYTGDEFGRYDNIFRKARTDIKDTDKERLIASLKRLSTGENLENVVDISAVLRYFTVQSFVVNLDSYLGRTGHNYYLYEKDGVLSMLPWDYNLAYGTYSLGRPELSSDATSLINYPIDTPAPWDVMVRRPMFYNLLFDYGNLMRYHNHYNYFIYSYFDSGYFEEKVEKTISLISPYVERDPTKFCSHDDFLLAADTFTDFCLLRAKSVKGQLDGSIPSTISGQGEDTSSLIDASSISINDLGDFEDMKRLVEGRLPR